MIVGAYSSTQVDVTKAFSVLGIAGQAIVAFLVLASLLALLGARGPLDAVRRALWGYELWAGFIVAAAATGGSLFYSEVMGFVPCELCWYQRICMYPLSILLLVAAWYGQTRLARYLVLLPIVGAGVSIYHMLIQYHVIKEPAACTISAPGAGCGTNWLGGTPPYGVGATFGYLAIPTLAFTAFALLIGFLVLASTGTADDAATLPADA